MSSAFSPDGLLYAAGNNHGVTHIWVSSSQASGGWRVLAELKGHEGDVVACAWSVEREKDKGLVLMTAGVDKEVRWWQSKDGTLGGEWKVVSSFSTGHADNLSDCVLFSYLGTHALVTASADKTIKVHTKGGSAYQGTWACRAVLEGHEKAVLSVAASVDFEGVMTLASCALDGTARLWTAPAALADLAGASDSKWESCTLPKATITQHGGDRRLAFCPTDSALLALTSDKVGTAVALPAGERSLSTPCVFLMPL
jgi:WD40 repeat protein